MRRLYVVSGFVIIVCNLSLNIIDHTHIMQLLNTTATRHTATICVKFTSKRVPMYIYGVEPTFHKFDPTNLVTVMHGHIHLKCVTGEC